MYAVRLSVLFYWLIQQGVDATLTPSGPTVSVDCGSPQTFTCSVTGAGAVWTITGLGGITASGTSGLALAVNNSVTTTDSSGTVQNSTITITGFTTADDGGTVQCVNQVDNTIQGMTTVSVGPPQCGTVGVVQGYDSCPSFNYTPQGSVLPSTVVVLYQLVADTSSAGSLNCSYPVEPQMCELVVPEGTYTVRATPQNSCGSPSSTCSSTVTVNVSAGCEPMIISPFPGPVSPGVIAGVVIGGLGVAAVVIVGVSGWCITILIMSCTCFASLGFLALLKCLCCPCCKGTARKSSSKHRHMRNESTVTLTNPPADEYADPQSSRDRKEKDRDKIQYADLDPEFYSRGSIHQKEEPVTYTAIQHA